MNGTAIIVASILSAMPMDYVPLGKPPENNDGGLDVAKISIDIASTNLQARNNPMPKHLKITVWQNMPYSGTTVVDGKLVGTGYAFVLFKIIQEKLKFTYEIVLPDPPNLGVHENKNFTGVVRLLQDKKVDMAVSFLPWMPELTKVLTFSNIVDENGITFMMRRPSESAIGSGLTAPFTQTVWICILVSLIIFGPLITVIIHYRTKVEESRGYERYSLTTCCWFAYGALIKQGSVVEPVTDSTRVLFASWWIFITILTSFYTANLTAFLTLSQFTLPFDSVEDIIDKRQAWFAYRDQFVDESLKFIKSDDPKDLQHLRNAYREGLGMYIEREKTQANVLQNLGREKLFLCERLMAEEMLFKDYVLRTRRRIKESKRCIYVAKPGVLYTRYRAFAYQKDSPLQEHVNRHLMNLVETGMIKHLAAQDVPAVKYCPLDLKSTERQLRNSDFELTYKIIGSGFAIGIAVFFGELIYTFGKRRKESGNYCGCCSSKIVNDEEAIEYKEDPRPDFLKKHHSPSNENDVNNEKAKRIFMNGRDYWVIKEGSGEQRLVPMRTPSALLFDYRS